MELVLRSGEQRVILGGLVGLSVEQSAVGELKILTLRISPSGAPPQNHAVLGAGARFEFRAGGRAYIVSVLRWDEETQEAALRVDRKI